MVASPVLMQAEGVLRPAFAGLVGENKFGGPVEFQLVSEPTGQNGQRKYLAAAKLLFLQYRADRKKNRAIDSLRRSFDKAKQGGAIPVEATFSISETNFRGRTLRFAVAILPCCGEFVATPTICD